MIIYKDAISGDELFTDSNKMIRKNGIIEIECKKTSEKVDIDDSLIGGNASAEEATEGADSGEIQGFDLAIQNRLQAMPPFDKKGYQAHIKGYLKTIKAKMVEAGRSTEDIAKFQENMTAYVKKNLANIANLEVFTGESMDPDGMQILLDYREDGIQAFMMFVEEGLIEEKA